MTDIVYVAAALERLSEMVTEQSPREPVETAGIVAAVVESMTAVAASTCVTLIVIAG